MKKLALLLCLLFCVTAFADKSEVLPLPAGARENIPWFAVRKLDKGNPPWTQKHLQKLYDEGAERVAFVYFATWCVPCRAGVLELVKQKDALKQAKVEVVLVNVGEKDEDLIGKWQKAVGAEDFTLLLDPFRRMTEGFKLIAPGAEMALPRTLVIDKNLKVVKMIGEEGSDWPGILGE